MTMNQLRVVPIRFNSKAPAVKDWKGRAKTIAEWEAYDIGQWKGHKRWGAPTGPGNGFWVLDVDPRHGGDVSLLNLVARYGPLPATRVVITPSGGQHLYFRWEQACALMTNTAGKLGPGLDIRVDGGQVLVPPTEGYVFESDAPIAPAPVWLLALLSPRAFAGVQPEHNGDGEAPIRNPKQWGARAIQSAIEEIQAAPEGARDATMNRNAYGLGRVVVACTLSRDKVVELLVDAAIAAGYDAHKALDCVNRAVDAGMQNPREVAAPEAARRERIEGILNVHDEALAPGDTQLRPMPPKPGPQPADLTSEAGRRWLDKSKEYGDWNASLRKWLDARLVVVQYDQSRVLYERLEGNHVAVLGAADVQAAAVRRIGQMAGLLVPRPTADALVTDYLGRPDATRRHPTLWDDGSGLYLHAAPVVEESPTPTWDGILSRLSDPEAFLAHVWSAFEPKFEGRQALWLQGEGNDGKSILFDALFEGASLPYASLGDNDLVGGNQFVFSSVWDKPVVLVGESKNVNVLMSGMVHKLTGRDPIPVEYKHGQRFNAKFQGVVFVTSNNKPQIERTRSNLSRLSLVTIQPGDWVDDLKPKLRREVPGLLFRAREAYARACPRHFEIALNETSKELLGESTAHDFDKHATLLSLAGLRIEGDGFIPRKEIHLRLTANSSTRLEDGKLASFYRWLEQQPGVRAVKIDGVRGFRGLAQ